MRIPGLAALLVLVAAMPAAAIVMRHDVDAREYLAGDRRLAAVGQLDTRIETVLIADRWALTAAHAVEMLGPFDAPHVRFGERCHRVRRVILHPDWERGWPHPHEMHDLALLELELEQAVEGIESIPLYDGTGELGRIVTIAGRGRAGNGREGPAAEKDHVLRSGTNRIDAVTATTLFMIFDEPSSATPLEAISGSGDSGGPAFLDVDGALHLAGISSATTGVPDLTLSLYGTVDLYTRVSAFSAWIHNVISGSAVETEWTSPAPCGRGRWPRHSASRLAESFFDAWGAGSSAAFEPFYRDVDDPDERTRKAENVFRNLPERYGPIEIESCATLGDREIRVLARTRDGSEWFSIGLRHAAEKPEEMERLYLKPERPPGAPSRCEESIGR
ncbi:MAG TPA: trypsin-like serine protease [Thermoanaerobaculia bacterium]|nr:trypsin-like serine protease [Thermoanaerobaculia bacterium]